MLTHPRQLRARILQITDGLLFAFALATAYLLRAFSAPLADLPALEDFRDYLWLLPAIGIIGPATLAKQGFYHHQRVVSRWSTVLLVMRAFTFATIAMVLLLFLIRTQYARSVIILACFFGGLLSYIRHEVFLQLADTRLVRDQWRQRILWVGDTEQNRLLRESLSTDERGQIESISEFDPRTDSIVQLTAILHEFSINAVVVNLAGIDTARLPPVLTACEREGVTVIVRPGVFARGPFGMTVDWFAGEPVIHYIARPAKPSHLFIKHALDTLGAAVLLVLAAPLLLLVALLVRVSSPGPVLFRQQRAGLNGKPFSMLKFRSMKIGADKEQATLADRNQMTGPVFKLTNDPRITPVGRILRRLSLDELPQLWNVLRGEMSLVGPRPLPVHEVKRFTDDAHRRRLSMRPGLTCLWQIRGRNNITDFEEWVRLDLAYIDQWSLWLDVKILIGTIPVVLFGHGAR